MKNSKTKEEKFMKKLYEECYEDIKKFEVARNSTKNEIYGLIGYAITKYQNKLNTLKAKKYIINAVLMLLTKDKEDSDKFIEEKLSENVDKICKFYGYKLTEKEKKDVVNKAFAGLSYKERKDSHDGSLKKNTCKWLLALILGKITFNKVARNKKSFDILIGKEFEHYSKRIAGILISEITRIRNDIFLNKNKGKKVRYCSVLEKNTCADCADLDGEIFNADEALDIIPQHNRCKCYWTVVEGGENDG